MPWATGILHPAYLPMDEKLPLQIEDPYGLSKQVDEATALMMPRRHGLTVVANDKRLTLSLAGIPVGAEI